MAIAVISSRGQITVPAKLRKQLNLQAGDRVDVSIEKSRGSHVPNIGARKRALLIKRFLSIAGCGHSGVSDLAANHDKYLDEAYDE